MAAHSFASTMGVCVQDEILHKTIMDVKFIHETMCMCTVLVPVRKKDLVPRKMVFRWFRVED